MLLVLILCAFLRTLQGAPLPPPNGSSSAATPEVFGIMARECPVSSSNDGDQQLRTVYDIMKSCLLTIFACVWQSAHPNINGPRDSGWARLKRKIVTMLCVIIAPEMVFLWALQQRSGAMKIAERYNKEFSINTTAANSKKSIWGEIKDRSLSHVGKAIYWFRPLPKATERRGNGQSWTLTHGFFLQMGGFMLYENEYPKQVLDFIRLTELLRDKAIDAPTVTERELQDRSKGDAISKAIVVLQTTWFALQCIGRWAQHLPLSELEVLTLAFTVMNAAIYAVWWNKPQGADSAICVPLKIAKTEVVNPTTPLMGEGPQEPVNLPQADYQHSKDNLRLILPDDQQRDENTGEKQSWLRCRLREDRKRHSSPSFFLFYLPKRIISSMIYPFKKMAESEQPGIGDLRVPMFYAGKRLRPSSVLVPCVLGTVFGAIHLIAWASEFPSPPDRVLWRVSAIILIVTPTLLQLFLWIANIRWYRPKIIGYMFFPFPLCTGLLYAAARCVVIIIALQAIRHPSRDVLRDVSWTSHLPHL